MRQTQQPLETHLWGAANILRGKTAGQDYKDHILSLLGAPGHTGSLTALLLDRAKPLPGGRSCMAVAGGTRTPLAG